MTRGKLPIFTSIAGALLAVLASGVGASDFGVCPPYSKTFGPEAPAGDITAFISEINLRPGGGTLILEPGEYRVAVPPITGVVCVRSSEEGSRAEMHGKFLVETGAILTVRSMSIRDDDDEVVVHVGAGATFFGENSDCNHGRFVNNGTAFPSNFTVFVGNGDWAVDLAAAENFGTLLWRVGSVEADVGCCGYGSAPAVFRNHGWALLERVNVLTEAASDPFSCYSGYGIENVDGGTLTLAQTTMAKDSCSNSVTGESSDAGEMLNGPGSVAYVTSSTLELGLTNDGIVEIEQSIVGGCAGSPVTDTGYNVFGDMSCAISEPTSVQADPGFVNDSLELGAGSPAIDLIPLALCSDTDALGRPRNDGNHDGTVACDAGALEYQGPVGTMVTFKTSPLSREYGEVDLAEDSALYVFVLSAEGFDPTTVVASSVSLVGSDVPALGGTRRDWNGDGVLDLRVRFRLDQLSLACGRQEIGVTAMTTAGELLTGELKLDVIGCTS